MSKPKKPVTTRRVRTTPQMAAAWLAAKGPNRNLHSGVDAYAADMIAGRWDDTGEPLIFDEDGVLIDGQNRLTAQVKAGVTIEWMISEGVSKTAMRSINVGVPRSPSDVEKIANQTTHARFKIAVVKAIRDCAFGLNGRTSVSERHDMIELLGDSMEWAADCLRRGSAASPAPVAGALTLAHWKDREKVEAFARRLIDGVGLASGDPAYALREHILTTLGATSASNRVHLFRLTLSMVNADLEGRRIKVPRVREGDVEIFIRPEIQAGFNRR